MTVKAVKTADTMKTAKAIKTADAVKTAKAIKTADTMKTAHSGVAEKAEDARTAKAATGGMTSVYLVGAPNTGKSTLFGALSGRYAPTGNREGVTVSERTVTTRLACGEGPIPRREKVRLTDLPGIRVLPPAAPDEQVSLRVLTQAGEDAVAVFVADAGRLAEGLALFFRLQEYVGAVRDKPLAFVLAVNGCDKLKPEAKAAGAATAATAWTCSTGGRDDIGPAPGEAIGSAADAATAATAWTFSTGERDDIGPAPGAAIGSVAGAATAATAWTFSTGGRDDIDPAPGADTGTAVASHSRPRGTPPPPAAVPPSDPVAQVLDEALLERLVGVPAVGLSARRRWGLSRLSHLLTGRTPGIGIPSGPVPGFVSEPVSGQTPGRADFIAGQVLRGRVPPPSARRRRVDDLLTQGPVGVAVLILVFAALMTLAFGPPGNLLCDLLTRSLAPLGDLVAAGASWMPQVLRSLLTEGVLSGVGTVLSFLPRLLLLWLGIGMLEDSGYLPRAARLADPFMARIGLCGEALIPLLLGFGCSVPAAMTTRTVADPHQRERVLRLLPLVTCSARMPLFSLLAEAFFGGDRPFGTLLFCAGMYVLSVAVVLLTAALQTALTAAVTDAKTARPGAVTAMKHSQDSGKAGPGLKPTVAANRNKLAACGAGTCSCGAACGVGPDRERPLPPLAWPSVGAVLSEAAGRLAAFLGRVSGVILLTSLLAWLLLHTSPRLTWVAEPGTGEECLLLLLGRWLLPLTTPLGLSHPALAAALLAGVGAKESIVSVLAICLTGLTGGAADGSADLTRLGAALAASGWLTPASALSLAVFAAFYMPCTAALSSLASEWPGPRSGQRHGPRHGPRAGLFLALLRSLLLAWVLAWLAGRLAFLFGL